ncbi:MAG: glutamate-ammonia-ligase adenylyltransferase, partial [Lentisphaerae bacterium]|nr:glutamate-ammonia-ligase adenylyltransferase [Lentisphaerota bacterium]
MKPAIDDLRRLAPDLQPELLCEHLDRLDDNYFQTFTPQQTMAHLRKLTALSHDHPMEVIFAPAADGGQACTILAFDYSSVFSLITGLLSSTGFNILSGEIFTSKRTDTSRRIIIDHFVGRLAPGTDAAAWSQELQRHLRELLPLLESGQSANAVRARHLVNEMVAARLADLQQDDLPVLYPVHIEAAPLAGYTRLLVLSQDTPAFLYAMSSALALQGISIERVRIRTAAGRITDEIDVLDRQGRPLTDPDKLDQLKFSVLLTKQFTYFLTHAPDPYTALCRFEQMVENIIQAPRQGEWLALLSRPDALQELARLLGASDFIWEDFIRLQYETLLPILQPHLNGQNLAHSHEEQADRLRTLLNRTNDPDEQCRLLNDFKDRELFLLDMDHILDPRTEVRAFAEALTKLAELVITTAADIVFQRLTARYGQPRTVAGLPLSWAIFGLGKFGGAAMGYASDIELLLIYSDNGRTDGREPISNAEFFNEMARGLTESVRAKREGIFHIDLRLRPYGNSGPLACSLESFCRYYAPDGPAHAYERLALVRMRAVTGDSSLGARGERLRDEFIYAGQSIDLAALQTLRRRQFEEKTARGQTTQNAKFSPGALVDLEYDVQILQVMHAAGTPGLRTPRIHQALAALADLGVLTPAESRELAGAYYFLRRLINGLRMLRGSARDLNLPPAGSPEFAHLARRMGYRRGGPLEPEQQLRVEFATQTAIVRAFVENHFGRAALPGPPDGNLADLALSESMPENVRDRI